MESAPGVGGWNRMEMGQGGWMMHKRRGEREEGEGKGKETDGDRDSRKERQRQRNRDKAWGR